MLVNLRVAPWPSQVTVEESIIDVHEKSNSNLSGASWVQCAPGRTVTPIASSGQYS